MWVKILRLLFAQVLKIFFKVKNFRLILTLKKVKFGHLGVKMVKLGFPMKGGKLALQKMGQRCSLFSRGHTPFGLLFDLPNGHWWHRQEFRIHCGTISDQKVSIFQPKMGQKWGQNSGGHFSTFDAISEVENLLRLRFFGFDFAGFPPKSN